MCGRGPTGHSAACAEQVRIDHVLDPHYATPLLGPRPLYHFYFAWRAQIGVLLPQSRPNSAHGHTRISTQPGGQRVSGGWVGATERRPQTWHAESRQPTASSCGTRDAKCTWVTIRGLQEQDCKAPIRLFIGRPCAPPRPDLTAPASLPVNLV